MKINAFPVKFLSFLISAVCVSLCSCSSEPGSSLFKEKYKEPTVFPRIKDAQVSFEIVSTTGEFYAGNEASITFRLKNIGKNKLIIYEWLGKNEEDNIQIFYTPYNENVKGFSEKEWKTEAPNVKKTKHLALELNPGGSVIIEKKIDFIEELDVKKMPKQGYEFYVTGKLNLKSLPEISKPIRIKVK